MNQQLQIQIQELKEPYCLILKNGIKIWLPNESGEALMKILEGIKVHQSLVFQGFSFNTAEHVGVFPQFVMMDLDKEKSGYWRCSKLKWHAKGEPCTDLMPKFKPVPMPSQKEL